MGWRTRRDQEWRRPTRGFVTPTYISLKTGKQNCSLKAEDEATGHGRRDRATERKKIGGLKTGKNMEGRLETST